MSILDRIFGGNFDPASLPEPPAEIKELVDGIMGKVSAAMKGEPCPNCGKVHSMPQVFSTMFGDGEDSTPSYQTSDGAAGEFEYVPTQVKAIQLTETNTLAVVEFLIGNGIPFAFCGNMDEKESFHLHILFGKSEDVELGSWIATKGVPGSENFSFNVYQDAAFREIFRAKTVSPATDGDLTGSFPVAAGPEDVLREHGSDWSAKAQQEALETYGDGSAV